MNYSDRIKAARKHAGLTQMQLASAVGIDQTSISNLERGKSQGSSHTASIATACGVSALWLESGLGEMLTDFVVIDRPTPPNAQLVGPFNIWDSESPLGDSEVYIPFLDEKGDVFSGHWRGVAISATKNLRFDAQILARQGISPKQAYCVEVRGNSMEPVMPSGSTVAINASILDVEDGKIYAIAHDGQLRVKLLYRGLSGAIRLRSYNQAEYEDELYTLDDAAKTNLKILGRVFWYSVIL